MRANPLVSICVPIYGVERFIRRCAESLFQQTYNNIEFVFINDCTKDKSIDILNQLIETYPIKERTHIIHHTVNRGLAAARNTGVENSRGELLLWVDSDDYIESTTVEKLVNKHLEEDADIVCYDIRVVFRDHETCYLNEDYKDGKDLTLKMLQRMAPHQLCGHLIKRSLYLENGIRAVEGINQSEDFQVMPRLAYYANKVSTVHECLYVYDRTRESSYSNNFTVRLSQQTDAAYDVLLSFFCDKENEFKEQLKESLLNSAIRRLMMVSTLDDSNYYSCLLSIVKKTYRGDEILRFDYRVAMFLSRKKLVRLFVNTVDSVVYRLKKTHYLGIVGKCRKFPNKLIDNVLNIS